eukprot:TRINITY_DN23472_c0_g1_i1.p1 TRINITY_DN23472_c0_g1~~TRINITY_DN23472_c0_g1_i1.p1  ORF type:complete len:779 (+),score=169.12 TRINITY_DN23472_c0_g1_i1:169-2337(+)
MDSLGGIAVVPVALVDVVLLVWALRRGRQAFSRRRHGGSSIQAAPGIGTAVAEASHGREDPQQNRDDEAETFLTCDTEKAGELGTTSKAKVDGKGGSDDEEDGTKERIVARDAEDDSSKHTLTDGRHFEDVHTRCHNLQEAMVWAHNHQVGSTCNDDNFNHAHFEAVLGSDHLRHEVAAGHSLQSMQIDATHDRDDDEVDHTVCLGSHEESNLQAAMIWEHDHHETAHIVPSDVKVSREDSFCAEPESEDCHDDHVARRNSLQAAMLQEHERSDICHDEHGVRRQSLQAAMLLEHDEHVMDHGCAAHFDLRDDESQSDSNPTHVDEDIEEEVVVGSGQLSATLKTSPHEHEDLSSPEHEVGNGGHRLSDDGVVDHTENAGYLASLKRIGQQVVADVEHIERGLAAAKDFVLERVGVAPEGETDSAPQFSHEDAHDSAALPNVAETENAEDDVAVGKSPRDAMLLDDAQVEADDAIMDVSRGSKDHTELRSPHVKADIAHDTEVHLSIQETLYAHDYSVNNSLDAQIENGDDAKMFDDGEEALLSHDDKTIPTCTQPRGSNIQSEDNEEQAFETSASGYLSHLGSAALKLIPGLADVENSLETAAESMLERVGCAHGEAQHSTPVDVADGNMDCDVVSNAEVANSLPACSAAGDELEGTFSHTAERETSDTEVFTRTLEDTSAINQDHSALTSDGRDHFNEHPETYPDFNGTVTDDHDHVADE